MKNNTSIRDADHLSEKLDVSKFLAVIATLAIGLIFAMLPTICLLGVLGASGCGGDTGPGAGNPASSDGSVAPNNDGSVAGECFSGSFGGATYSACSIGTTWDQAKSACESKGSMLAVIMTSEENDYLGQFVLPMFGKTSGVWIGARRQGTEFMWINGTNMNATPTRWGSREPAQSPSDCVLMGLLGNGLWSTRDCPGFVSSPTFYLCKFGG